MCRYCADSERSRSQEAPHAASVGRGNSQIAQWVSKSCAWARSQTKKLEDQVTHLKALLGYGPLAPNGTCIGRSAALQSRARILASPRLLAALDSPIRKLRKVDACRAAASRTSPSERLWGGLGFVWKPNDGISGKRRM